MEKFGKKLKGFLKENWILLLIIALAAILRFYKLDSLPPGLYPDEAANGQDVIRMIDNHDFRVVYDTNGPREALFLYLQGIFVWLGQFLNITALKFTALSLRIAPAIIGTLTIWAIYLFGKELADSKRVGLIAAAALAVSSWHIQFSRNGFRAIMLPLMLCLIFYFFIKAYREGKLKDYLWFGAMLGIGFYTYLSIRMLPLAFMAFIGWALLYDKDFLKKNVKNIMWALGSFGIMMIPMLIHFVHVPADIFGRASTSIFNPEFNNGSAIGTLLQNIKKELLMFNFKGDENYRHNLGGAPMLEWASGIFMWVGLVISLIKFKKIGHFILLALFGAMSVPMVLTAEGIPHALRLVGVIPVVFIWIALGIDWLVEKLPSKTAGYGIIGLIIVLSSYLAIDKYFVRFPNQRGAHEAYTEDMVSMAQDLRKSPDDRMNYLVTGEFGLKTVDFLTHGKNLRTVQLETYEVDSAFRPAGNKYKIYITPNWFEETKRKLEAVGYNLNYTAVNSEFDGRVLYYVYEN